MDGAQPAMRAASCRSPATAKSRPDSFRVGTLGSSGERLGPTVPSLAWRMRAKIGERVKWYNEVEEVRF